jgi:hypothetical protein
VVTQDAADVLGSDLGLAVISNAATQILMRQAPQAIDAVTAAFLALEPVGATGPARGGPGCDAAGGTGVVVRVEGAGAATAAAG